MPDRSLVTDLIYWDITNTDPGAWGTDPESHRSVLLRLTDNPGTELGELRVEPSPDDYEPIMVFARPWFTFESNALEIEGHVPRKGHRTDPEETWLARPLTNGQAAPWKVEITTSDGGDLIDVIEPASLKDVSGFIYKGQWTAHDELPDDFWSTGAWKDIEPESTLRIHGPSNPRNVHDWSVTKIRRWEIVIEGTTKHHREQIAVQVKLTPSHVIEAARSLGA